MNELESPCLTRHAAARSAGFISRGVSREHLRVRVHVFFVMIRRQPRSTQGRSSAASDVYKRQSWSIDNFWYLTQSRNYLDGKGLMLDPQNAYTAVRRTPGYPIFYMLHVYLLGEKSAHRVLPYTCLLYTSLSPRDRTRSRMPSSA